VLFNSLEFLVFLPVFMAVYFATRGRTRLVLCVVASYVFYAMFDWRFLALLAFITLANFDLGKHIAASDNQRRRKILLVASLVVNLGVLGAFKYFNFFIESAATVLGALGLDTSGGFVNIVLPIGISFYTFSAMTYTIDLYRNDIQVERSLLRFAAFIALFPKLVLGPIVRASELLPQLAADRTPTWRALQSGFLLVLLGLFKKVVIADNCAPLVDGIFLRPDLFTSLNVLLGAYLYAFQLYCDFSGYTDIAIGIGRMLGFEFPKNFDRPFFSQSIGQFWRRWHMSLSFWLRDYLYIPLGGSRCGSVRTYRNLIITMVLCGLWHGAAWTYVLFGLLHGLFLTAQKLIGGPFRRAAAKLRIPDPVVNVALVVITFHLCSLTFVIFRADSFGNALHVYSRIFSFDTWNPLALKQLLDLARALGLISLLALLELISFRFSFAALLERSVVLRVAAACAAVWLILILGNFSGAQFIYFQF